MQPAPTGAKPRTDSTYKRGQIGEQVSSIDLHGADFLYLEAAIIRRSNIASTLYPELFKPGASHVDKDGLSDYHNLIARFKEVQPGVFHDSKRDLLLFAHRFFRRNLSHRNKLNTFFLESFGATARENSDLKARLRIDPDLLGHPASSHHLIELEHWRGPRFSDDIPAIPDGVAEHKADERTRLYEGVDRTHIWWKLPESRNIEGRTEDYRTCEIEELVENPAMGLGDNLFGCRYAHAEFSRSSAAITHFDGAIRAYSAEDYLRRIDTSIDRAGKHAHYTKLFRLDNALSVSAWKRLLSDFFRGNKLIPEYLGATFDEKEAERSLTELERSRPANESRLAAFVALGAGPEIEKTQLKVEFCQETNNGLMPYVEIGTGEVAKHLRRTLDFTDVATVGMRDGILNLSRIEFVSSENLKDIFDRNVVSLGEAVNIDALAGVLNRVAIPLTWKNDELLVTLTIAGDAKSVSSVLMHLPSKVDPTQLPSSWIEGLSTLIKTTSTQRDAPIIWGGTQRGVLEIVRRGVVEQEIFMSDALKRRFFPDLT